MNSIILKTLAAASLVAAAQAQVHVLGAVWKERGLSAPAGTIVLNPGTTAAIRGYMIFDPSILTAAPGPGTLIQYRDARSGGVIQRTYTINSGFRAFSGDIIAGDSGGRRIYGQIHAPTTIANVPNATLPYSGSALPTGYPSKLRFDDTVFQVGTATPLTGPQIVDLGATLARSVISGSASSVNVEATSIAGATAELTARLEKAGFTRAAVVPVITTGLPATIALQDGQSQVLSVTVGADAFPAPIYKWFRNDVQVSTAPTFTVTGADAATGPGTYRVEVSSSAGTATSTTTVTSVAYTFATNLPPTLSIQGASSAVLSVVLSPEPIPAPIPQPTYQWFKNNVAITAANGGTTATLLIIGGEAITGAGTYRVQVTNGSGVVSVSGNSVVSVPVAGTAFVFTTNTPRTAKPLFTTTVNLSPVVNTAAVPSSVSATRQWFKAPLDNPTAFAPIPAGDGGTTLILAVSGDNANVKGPGVYRLVVTSTVAPITTITSIDTVVTTGP
jgi:hypothetical protein